LKQTKTLRDNVSKRTSNNFCF